MSTLGIVSARIAPDGSYSADNYELTSLIQQAESRFDRVALLSYENLLLKATVGSRVQILSNGKDLTMDLSALIARGTGRHDSAAHGLAEAASTNGVVLLDSPSRFAGSSPDKVISTLMRHRAGVGMPSALAFGPSCSEDLLRQISDWGMILVKPVRGRQGSGIKCFSDVSELAVWTAEHWARSTEPLLLQKHLSIVEEWRVVVMWGFVIGTAVKVADVGALTANAATGARFEAPTDDIEEIEAFAMANAPVDGFVGMDIARDATGALFVIESNFSPNWRAFDAALEINTAEIVVDVLADKVQSS